MKNYIYENLIIIEYIIYVYIVNKCILYIYILIVKYFKII